MTEVTRFPHYHHPENIVTNHVMVMLRMLYNASPKLLEGLLQALCADEVTIGPRFSQQIAGTHSVPDGLILQEPLAIFVETKLGPHLNMDQLKRHCETIAARLAHRKGSFLIALNSGIFGTTLPEELIVFAREQGIQIITANFSELIEQISELPVSDLTLREAIQEFTDFIYAQGLIPRRDQFLVAMLTGYSWRENLKYCTYYEPFERNPKWPQAAFLGLYHERHVSHIGRIIMVISAFENDMRELIFDNPEMGILDDAKRQTIREMIDSSQEYYPNFQENKIRYYIVDKFEQTDFKKKTRGGMMGHRYFDIETLVGKRLPPNAPSSLAADILRGCAYD